jgi:hypothetical protein
MPRYLVLLCMPVALAITATHGYAVADNVKTTQGVVAPKIVPKKKANPSNSDQERGSPCSEPKPCGRCDCPTPIFSNDPSAQGAPAKEGTDRYWLTAPIIERRRRGGAWT